MTEEKTPTFAAGDIVEVKPEVIPKLNSVARRTAEGRRAVVDRCFVPMGARDERVRLYWLHRRNGSRSAAPEFWNAEDLLRVQMQESPK